MKSRLFAYFEGTELINLREDFGLDVIRGKNFKELDQKLLTSFTEEDCDWLFVQPSGGRISVKQPIDREELCKHDTFCQIRVKVLSTSYNKISFHKNSSFTFSKTCVNHETCNFNCLELDLHMWSLWLQVFIRSISQIVEVIVDVIDVNEFAPEFPFPSIPVNVSESSNINDIIDIDDKYLPRDRDAGKQFFPFNLIYRRC